MKGSRRLCVCESLWLCMRAQGRSSSEVHYVSQFEFDSSVEIGDVRELLGSLVLALEMSPSLLKQQPPAPYVLEFFNF